MVLALGRRILSEARRAYEQAHRPAVLRAADRYLAEWTDGRYERIIAPDGGEIEAVEHRRRGRVPLTGLSAGTAQQVYLAIRLGLVELFAGGGEPLPVVMDDILVNFDPDRAARAARSIEALAERQQVIYFTCHPTTPLGGLRVELPSLEPTEG